MCNFYCKKCNKTYHVDIIRLKCNCGGVLNLNFRPVFDLDKIKKRKPTMWRYREAIPVNSDKNIVSFDEGFTPLLEIYIDGYPVMIKQDQLFSSGSYKDRGASVLISKMKELGISSVVEDSSGNAGSAVAAYCAKGSIKCKIYVPEKTSPAKLIQIQNYGARLIKVSGSREDTANAAIKALEDKNIREHYASHIWNPFFLHGTKTFAFEVAEQLDWKAPDTVILPVGNGTILLGAYIGFTELHSAGIIKKIPKLVGIQAKNCAPVYHAFKNSQKSISLFPNKPTIAEGIAIAKPARKNEILEAIQKTNGKILSVSETEIKQAHKTMDKKGYCIEPTSAATIAGIYKYLKTNPKNKTIVSIFTGHGLKHSEVF
jgi:threonine synthase